MSKTPGYPVIPVFSVSLEIGLQVSRKDNHRQILSHSVCLVHAIDSLRLTTDDVSEFLKISSISCSNIRNADRRLPAGWHRWMSDVGSMNWRSDTFLCLFTASVTTVHSSWSTSGRRCDWTRQWHQDIWQIQAQLNICTILCSIAWHIEQQNPSFWLTSIAQLWKTSKISVTHYDQLLLFCCRLKWSKAMKRHDLCEKRRGVSDIRPRHLTQTQKWFTLYSADSPAFWPLQLDEPRLPT